MLHFPVNLGVWVFVLPFTVVVIPPNALPFLILLTWPGFLYDCSCSLCVMHCDLECADRIGQKVLSVG